AGGVAAGDVPRREALVGAVVVVQGEADLLEVVLALEAGRRLPHPLDGGQQQADQDRNNPGHHQQLHPPGTGTASLRAGVQGASLSGAERGSIRGTTTAAARTAAQPGSARGAARSGTDRGPVRVTPRCGAPCSTASAQACGKRGGGSSGIEGRASAVSGTL